MLAKSQFILPKPSMGTDFLPIILTPIPREPDIFLEARTCSSWKCRFKVQHSCATFPNPATAAALSAIMHTDDSGIASNTHTIIIMPTIRRCRSQANGHQARARGASAKRGIIRNRNLLPQFHPDCCCKASCRWHCAGQCSIPVQKKSVVSVTRSSSPFLRGCSRRTVQRLKTQKDQNTNDENAESLLKTGNKSPKEGRESCKAANLLCKGL